jgi:ubiquinone/menaquinone biosynthesis C-methylase UbiE
MEEKDRAVSSTGPANGQVAVSMRSGIRQATSSYYESNFISRWWRRGLAKMVRELLPAGWEGMNLLDVGTGDGYTIRLVKPQGEVIGIDPDSTMAASATAKGVVFREGSAYKIPFPDSSFDLATCIEVVEHLDTPKEALQELHRVLRPGGFAIMTTPVPKASWRLLWWAWTKFGPGKRWETSPHVTDIFMWGDEGLVNMLKRFGFEVQDTASCNLGYIAGVRAQVRTG